MNRQYKLFFSWQSEDKKSRKTLDVALQNAVEALNDRGIRLEIDHSTLGESGMPSIDQTILRKIDACDIFLADVTPVTTYQKSSGNGMQVSKEFFFIDDIESGIDGIKKETPTANHYYSPSGKLLDKPQKGLNIVVMSDGTTRKVVVK